MKSLIFIFLVAASTASGAHHGCLRHGCTTDSTSETRSRAQGNETFVDRVMELIPFNTTYWENFKMKLFGSQENTSDTVETEVRIKIGGNFKRNTRITILTDFFLDIFDVVPKESTVPDESIVPEDFGNKTESAGTNATARIAILEEYFNSFFGSTDSEESVVPDESKVTEDFGNKTESAGTNATARIAILTDFFNNFFEITVSGESAVPEESTVPEDFGNKNESTSSNEMARIAILTEYFNGFFEPTVSDKPVASEESAVSEDFGNETKSTDIEESARIAIMTDFFNNFFEIHITEKPTAPEETKVPEPLGNITKSNETDVTSRIAFFDEFYQNIFESSVNDDLGNETESTDSEVNARIAILEDYFQSFFESSAPENLKNTTESTNPVTVARIAILENYFQDLFQVSISEEVSEKNDSEIAPPLNITRSIKTKELISEESPRIVLPLLIASALVWKQQNDNSTDIALPPQNKFDTFLESYVYSTFGSESNEEFNATMAEMDKETEIDSSQISQRIDYNSLWEMLTGLFNRGEETTQVEGFDVSEVEDSITGFDATESEDDIIEESVITDTEITLINDAESPNITDEIFPSEIRRNVSNMLSHRITIPVAMNDSHIEIFPNFFENLPNLLPSKLPNLFSSDEEETAEGTLEEMESERTDSEIGETVPEVTVLSQKFAIITNDSNTLVDVI